jgi:hypothetical protein
MSFCSTKLDRISKMLSARLKYPFLGKLRAADLEKFVSNSLDCFWILVLQLFDSFWKKNVKKTLNFSVNFLYSMKWHSMKSPSMKYVLRWRGFDEMAFDEMVWGQKMSQNRIFCKCRFWLKFPKNKWWKKNKKKCLWKKSIYRSIDV